MQDKPNLVDNLPSSTTALIDLLDELVSAPTVSHNLNLNDPSVQRSLYVEAGRRQMVNELVAARRRQLERFAQKG